MHEAKSERFERLSESRKARLVHEIRLISNLSNTKNYKYTSEQVSRLFEEIDTALVAAKKEFERNLPSEGTE